MALSLFKAATYPNPTSDRGEHELPVSGRSVEFDVTNFEIVTLRVIAKNKKNK